MFHLLNLPFPWYW